MLEWKLQYTFLRQYQVGLDIDYKILLKANKADFTPAII